MPSHLCVCKAKALDHAVPRERVCSRPVEMEVAEDVEDGTEHTPRCRLHQAKHACVCVRVCVVKARMRDCKVKARNAKP